MVLVDYHKNIRVHKRMRSSVCDNMPIEGQLCHFRRVELISFEGSRWKLQKLDLHSQCFLVIVWFMFHYKTTFPWFGGCLYDYKKRNRGCISTEIYWSDQKNRKLSSKRACMWLLTYTKIFSASYGKNMDNRKRKFITRAS